MRDLLRLACKDVSKLVSASMDRRLGVRERVGVRLHLLVCDACRTMVRQFALLRKACRRYADGTESITAASMPHGPRLHPGVETRAARHDCMDAGGRATQGAVAERWRGCGFAAGTIAMPLEGGGLSAEARHRIRAALSMKCDSPGFP